MNNMFNAPGGPVDSIIGASMPVISITGSMNEVYCTSLSHIPPEFVTIKKPGGISIPQFRNDPETIIAEVERLHYNYKMMLMSIARIWNVLVSSHYSQQPKLNEVNWKYLIAVLDGSTSTSWVCQNQLVQLQMNSRSRALS
jgi:hypothetical protein